MREVIKAVLATQQKLRALIAFPQSIQTVIQPPAPPYVVPFSPHMQ
jgi:uncharacterized protein involved in exopolysaccharide biosynthesis